MSPPVLESAHEKHFRLQVRSRLGGQAIKIAPTVAGVPDRLVLLPGGRMVLVELKTITGALSPIQRLWHSRAHRLGIYPPVLSGKAEIDAWIAATLKEMDQEP